MAELISYWESRASYKNAAKKRHFLRESGGFGEQYHSEKPATMETWAGSNHGQTLVRLLEIRGACFKTSSGGLKIKKSSKTVGDYSTSHNPLMRT